MKNTLKLVAVLALATAAFSLQAQDAKPVSVSGEGKCAKCALKKSESCQNVVEVKDGDKTTTYYLTGDVSKAFHKNLCSATMKVNVTGVPSKDGDKHLIAVTKIEQDKK